ncbi:hypothetical protein Unana1_06476 [Umbelopsis nana]
MRNFSTITLFAAAAFVGSQIKTVVAASGQTVQVIDSKDFCFFLPPPGSSDMNISDNEGDAVAYCMGSTPQAPNANTFADGFILSAHFVSTSDYVQVTGQIDPSKANLNANDQGGQYDIEAPKGATCAGYAYFVNLVEPAGNDYCIRCCHSVANCNRGISQDGCARVIPGDYSGPGVSSSGSSSSSSSSSSSTTTTSPSSTSPTTGSSSGSSSGSGSTDTGSGSSSGTTDTGSSGTGSDSSASSPSSSAGWTEGAGTSGGVSSNVLAASSVAPSTSIAFVSAAASSSAAANSSSNLPTEGVSAQSVSAAGSLAPATITALALGGVAAFMQLI